jgi:signal transduction histidine kinase
VNSNATILIVDDEASNRGLFQAQLQQDGYAIMAAVNGEDALRQVDRQLPDLILLDAMMPGLNGFQVAERLKGEERTRHIPIIMITALDDQESRMQALSKGAEEFLTKPVRHSELLARVRNLLKLKQFQDRLVASSGALKEEVAERTLQLAQVNRQLDEAEVKAVQSEKLALIGQLAAGVAHEINNPIGYVNANLGSLKQYLDELLQIVDALLKLEASLPADTPGRAELQAMKEKFDFNYMLQDLPLLLQESQEGIARVRDIVQDLKAFSRIDSAREWLLADLHKGLNSTLNLANNEIKYKADVVKEYGILPEIECVPSQLNQVFLNLLVNAAHAIKDDARGTITLRTGCSDKEVWVEISDTGCGIAPEIINKVFDPFFTTKPVGKGTGLGLSLSYTIVQQHNGRIELDSKIGQGSTFRVVLPIRQPAV